MSSSATAGLRPAVASHGKRLREKQQGDGDEQERTAKKLQMSGQEKRERRGRELRVPREDAPRVKRMLTVRSSRVQGRGEEELGRLQEYEKERKRKRLRMLEEQQLRERSEERPLKVARTEAESRARGEEYKRQRGEMRFDRG